MVKQEVKTTLAQRIYSKNAEYESVRNLAENTLGITVKSKNDILKASTLKFLEETGMGTEEVLNNGSAIGVISKTTKDKLTLGDL